MRLDNECAIILVLCTFTGSPRPFAGGIEAFLSVPVCIRCTCVQCIRRQTAETIQMNQQCRQEYKKCFTYVHAAPLQVGSRHLLCVKLKIESFRLAAEEVILGERERKA